MFRYFWVNIIWRVALIFASCLHLAFVIAHESRYYNPIVAISILIVALVVYSLIRLIDRNNRLLANIVLSIRQRDYTQNFVEQLDTKGSLQLTQAFRSILNEFQKLNFENEEKLRLLDILNQNLQVGIIICNDEGKVKTLNDYAKGLLGIDHLHHLKDLFHHHKHFYSELQNIRSGDRKIVQHFLNDQTNYLFVNKKVVLMKGDPIHIYLIYNISSELNEKEFNAWQDLTNVLTHEIMNSVTPILSLTQAVKKIMTNSDGSRKDLSSLTEKNINDIYESLDTATKRGLSLAEFVKKYRDFAVMPQIYVEMLNLSELLVQTLAVVEAEFSTMKVKTELRIDPNVFILGDSLLLEQVLTNVIKNAFEALCEKSGYKLLKISLTHTGSNHGRICITDNAMGMDQETLSKIFIPFFSTKPKGSGIGLSLAKQIIHKHNGMISVQTRPNMGTFVTIDL